MFTQIGCVLSLTFILGSAANAGADPFCGKWKLNQEKSKIIGEQMKWEKVGANQFKFTFAGDSDIVAADGTDQPIRFGKTMVLSEEGPNSLKMVIKQDGKVISSMIHTLSSDGNTQTIKGTSMKPDGTTSDFEAVDKRVGGGSGWTGTWESTDVKFTSPDEWEINTYQTDGLTFYTPAYKDTLSMNFDGKEYEETGPTVAPGSMSSGKRLDAHTLEITDKVKGKVMDHTRFEVSPDGKTLTLSIHETDQPNPLTIVYDRM